MANFLWTTPAGAVDFTVMCLVLAAAIGMGRPWARWGAVIVAAVFIAERTIIATMPEPTWPVAGWPASR